MAYRELRYEVDGDVGVITLDRPEARNALTHTTYRELEEAVRTTAARCLVVTGTDPAFCAGDDVKLLMAPLGEAAASSAAPGATASPGATERATSDLLATPRLTPAADALLHTDVPVVAAVNGAAVGWGMELALMADLRVASERARFGELFVKRGLCCDVAGLGRLASLVGRERASELLFTGRIIDADEAGAIGLVSRIVPHGDLLPDRARAGAPHRGQPAAGGAADQAGPARRARPRLGRARPPGQRRPGRPVPHRRPPRGRRRVLRAARAPVRRPLTVPADIDTRSAADPTRSPA